jgi:ATP adenylyltransferase
MKLLWAPWRMSLIAAPKPPGCIFCTLPRQGDPRENLILAVNRTTVVMLNKFPYNSGHLMVAPRRHVADLERLRPAERNEIAALVTRAVSVIRRELRPDGMNVGVNLGIAAGAGIADHLHWHVVPRWVGDTNFMPTLGSVKVIPEHLLETYDRLRPGFTDRRRPQLPVTDRARWARSKATSGPPSKRR